MQVSNVSTTGEKAFVKFSDVYIQPLALHQTTVTQRIVNVPPKAAWRTFGASSKPSCITQPVTCVCAFPTHRALAADVFMPTLRVKASCQGRRWECLSSRQAGRLRSTVQHPYTCPHNAGGLAHSLALWTSHGQLGWGRQERAGAPGGGWLLTRRATTIH